MKIAVVGNLANLEYVIAKSLRNIGQDCDLFITCKKNNIHPTQNPDNYEKIDDKSWIKIYDTSNPLKAFVEGKKIFPKYDRIIALTLSPAYVQFFNKNFIAICNGSDIREFAFGKGIYNKLLKRAYKKAKHILCSISEIDWAPKALGIEKKTSLFPTPIETEKFERQNKANIGNEKLSIFLPSSWSKIGSFAGSKGTDIFLDGCADLLDKGYDFNIKIINQRNNPNTKPQDAEYVQNLLKKYPKNFLILEPIKDKNLLIDEYLKVDIVADQFFLGMFGMIGLETLSCKKPLINSYLTKYDKIYDNDSPPIIIANTKQEVSQKIKEIIDNNNRKEFLNNLGTRGYQWVKKHHDSKILALKIMDVI